MPRLGLSIGINGIRGGAPPVWAPTSASVPVRAWYRPDLGRTMATGVSQLNDQSGTGDANRNVVQATGAAQPGYTASDAAYGNKPVLTFNGSQALLRAGAWSVSQIAPVTLVVIGESTTVTTAFVSDTTFGDMIWNSAGNAKFYGPTAIDSATAIPGPTAIMVTDDGTGGAAAAKIYVVNFTTAKASTTTAWSSTTGLDLGSGTAGVGNCVGKIAEVILWGGVLTATDLTNLRTYLNTTQAYGLAIT